MIKYIFIICIFILVSCGMIKKVDIHKKNAFHESDLTLGKYMLSVRGEGENLEMSLPLLLWTNPIYTKVKEVKIKNKAVGSKDGSPSSSICKSFTMTEKEIKRYFYIASKISNYDAMKRIEWTDCYIGGDMVFENGTKAQWTIDAFMHGYITFSAKNKNVSYDVFCPQCSYLF